MFEFKKSTDPEWAWQKWFIRNAGIGTGNEPVVDLLTSLSPQTTYNFRLSATNPKGSNQGSASSFTTEPPTSSSGPPIVTTEAASEITSNGATLKAFVDPNGASTTYKFQYGTSEGSLTQSTPVVSIGTTPTQVRAEVPLEPGTVYYFRISATNSKNTSTGKTLNFTTAAAIWKIKETPNVGSNDTFLYDVSCEPSTNVCTSVGKSTSSGADSPVAQRWNGTSWSAQSPAKKSGTLPTRLFGVDCPSETRCLAAGSYQPAEGGPTLVTELWNEAKWNVQTPPVPAGATSSELTGIGCNNTAECTAVGSAMIGGVKKAIAMEWNSPTWTLQTVPIPEGAKSSQLDGVDCNWSNFCVAVGRYTTSGNKVRSLAMLWNGEWSLQTVPDPFLVVDSYLLDVSCTKSPNRCTAVGGWKNSFNLLQLTLAYRFDGSTWTWQVTPNPAGNIASVFEDVSCATETSCTAVGSWVGSGSNKTLAAVWSGNSWALQSSPNPANAAFSVLSGVSCRSVSCMGVGWSTNSSGTDTTLSEFRE